MIKSKSELEKYLSGEFLKIAVSNDKVKQISTYAFETYEMPKGLVSDYVCLRTALEQANEFVLFILLDSLEKTRKEKKSVIDKYYTMTEFKTYKNAKYNVDKIKFPLVFKMVQIDDSQWVGKIDVKMLMKLRAAQLINYNTATQRVMERIIQGDKEIYKISLNTQSVNEIAKEYENSEFIPNTITLNIPLYEECDFYYDEDSCQLVIKSLDHVDCIDGFHRFIAACKVSDMNPGFNYPIELRIVNWDEDRSRKFIYQEDKRNRMKKIDVESMNTNKASNIVVTRINENIRCNLKGMINRNNGLINFSELSEIINYFYFKGIAKKSENVTILKTVNELITDFNLLTELDMRYMEEKWSYNTILTVICAFILYKEHNKELTDIADTINKAVPLVNECSKIQGKAIRKAIVEEVKKIIESVM